MKHRLEHERADVVASSAAGAQPSQGAGAFRARVPIAPLARLGWLLLAWTLIVAGGPGLLASWPIVCIGLATWAATASRPGARAFLVEWVCAGIAWASICGWAAYVHWATLLFIGPGCGLYSACASAILRRIASRAPLAIAAPAAWLGIETLRAVLPVPPGFNWLRAGTHFHDSAWILGSARVWGVEGLGWAMLALAGVAADLGLALLVDRKRPSHWRFAALAGLAPLLAGAAMSSWIAPPLTEPGPTVLLVQPAIPQDAKMDPPSAQALFSDSRELTREALEQSASRGEPPPDLVAWSETMLGLPLIDYAIPGAIDRGARTDPWARAELDRAGADRLLDAEQYWVGVALFGDDGDREQGGVLPEGTSFLSGAEIFVLQGDRIRRQNVAVLWNARGERVGFGAKRFLVPGAESMVGLERFGWVRDAIRAVANYVPDFLPSERTAVLELETRRGSRYRFGATVCFDNAYDPPYVDPAADDLIDFHLVVSNEAWYRTSHEVDQMIAFSRLLAVSTGRSFVRATNSGISAVIAPDGGEVARLSIDGRDREVRGTLRAVVPTPIADERERKTAYVRSRLAWVIASLLAPLLCLIWAAWDGRGNRRGWAG